ncbi:hypothetical protein ACOSQ4_014406 [Xanthoceras sorbifolium]
MNAEEISCLCESLTLSDEEGPVLKLSGEAQQEGARRLNYCLVGKILCRKKINREAFKIVIEQIWNAIHGIEIELVGDNVFVFYFKDVEDKISMQSRGPWHFDKSLIILVEPKGAEFWIQIYNVPLLCMNKKVAKILAGSIGEAVEIPMEPKDC